jgi:hypothetical protein
MEADQPGFTVDALIASGQARGHRVVLLASLAGASARLAGTPTARMDIGLKRADDIRLRAQVDRIRSCVSVIGPERAGDCQAEERIPKMRQAALVLLRHNGMGFEERKNSRAGEGWGSPPLAVVLLVTWVLPVWGVLRSLFP